MRSKRKGSGDVGDGNGDENYGNGNGNGDDDGNGDGNDDGDGEDTCDDGDSGDEGDGNGDGDAMRGESEDRCESWPARLSPFFSNCPKHSWDKVERTDWAKNLIKFDISFNPTNEIHCSSRKYFKIENLTLENDFEGLEPVSLRGRTVTAR